jgi:hypothetical protein
MRPVRRVNLYLILELPTPKLGEYGLQSVNSDDSLLTEDSISEHFDDSFSQSCLGRLVLLLYSSSWTMTVLDSLDEAPLSPTSWNVDTLIDRPLPYELTCEPGFAGFIETQCLIPRLTALPSCVKLLRSRPLAVPERGYGVSIACT